MREIFARHNPPACLPSRLQHPQKIKAASLKSTPRSSMLLSLFASSHSKSIFGFYRQYTINQNVHQNLDRHAEVEPGGARS
jgi:hypothetical protein